jgi:GeoRSP system SPASM domain protein
MKQEGSSDLLPSSAFSALHRSSLVALDLLDAPLRMTWDLCPDGQAELPEEQIGACGDALVDAGIFSLILQEHPLLYPGLESLLDLLQLGACETSLVVGGDPGEWLRLTTLQRRFPLLVDAAPWLKVDRGLKSLKLELVPLLEAGWPVSLLWVPVSGQLKVLPDLLELCRCLDLPRFKLPNPKIDVTAENPVAAGFLLQKDLLDLQDQLKKEPLTVGTTLLEVHDLFLWELLFPKGGGQRSEYGGCQAGNSIGHLSACGEVWPCSSWPQVLGRLPEENLLEIWNSASRFQVRDEVNDPPPDCHGCQIYSRCFGGCRGLARQFRSGEQRRDLLCSGPRISESV